LTHSISRIGHRSGKTSSAGPHRCWVKLRLTRQGFSTRMMSPFSGIGYQQDNTVRLGSERRLDQLIDTSKA
jgi:hypothetical protein